MQKCRLSRESSFTAFLPNDPWSIKLTRSQLHFKLQAPYFHFLQRNYLVEFFLQELALEANGESDLDFASLELSAHQTQST
jgi:hypothetical protein